MRCYYHGKLFEIGRNKNYKREGGRLLLISSFSLLFCLPSLVTLWNSPVSIALSLTCYAPFIFLWSSGNKLSSLKDGVILGLCISLIAAGWVWTYLPLPNSVAILVVVISAILFSVTSLIAKSIAFLISDHKLVHSIVLTLALVIFEWFRSISPNFFLPLGSIAQAASVGMLLPVAALGGTSFFSFFILACNVVLGFVTYYFFINIKKRNLSIKSLSISLAVLSLFSTFLVVANNLQTEYPPTSEDEVWCASTDPNRRERGIENQFQTSSWVYQTSLDSAFSLGCNMIVFPEYTLEVARTEFFQDQLVSISENYGHNQKNEPWIYVGTLMERSFDSNDKLDKESWVTNSICRMKFTPESLICEQKVDKRYMAPMVEASLFYDSVYLKRIGAYLTKLLTGYANDAKVDTSTLYLDYMYNQRVGVLTCLELFIPNLGRRLAREQQIDFFIAPTDISDFTQHPIVLRQYQRAAALQAVTSGKPVIFVSTDSVNLFLHNGKMVNPDGKLGTVSMWLNPI